MEAPHPGGEGDAWDESGCEGGQNEVDAGGDGQSEPEVGGGAVLLPSLLPQPSLLFLLSRLLPSLRSDPPCLRRAGGAEG